MSTEPCSLTFSGRLLARGFWLYVWRVVAENGHVFLYVGRTGDSSSPRAQSPFARLSQHLGMNPNANALRRHLRLGNIDPESCLSFELHAYGPILPEVSTMDEHRPCRDKIGALEKALRDDLVAAGYRVLNQISFSKRVDTGLYDEVRTAFAKRFDRLALKRKVAQGAGV